MVFPSSYIAQSIASQNSMFSGMQAFSAQASYQSGMMGGAPPPPPMQMLAPPPAPTMMGVMRGYGGYSGGPTAGAWGDAIAGRLVSGAQTGMGLAGAGVGALGIAGSMGLIGGPLGAIAGAMDPLGLALRAGGAGYGAMGGGMMGLAGGAAAMGAVALPAYAAMRYGGALAQNFTGGMQDQMALNSNLRQNFNFMGGQGAFGRGFSQSQMGQIGGVVGQELRGNVFTSAGELNQLISGGAQMGSFTGVRDVQSFTQRFREMITTLRTVQRELGGSLQEAQEFVNQSRQAGVFGSTQATRFAATIRNTSAVTGMDQGQLLQLSSEGAQISRAFGGRGAQGARGALRGLTTLSTAMQAGVVSEAMLSEATGGRTGTDAMSAFVTDMMQHSGQFSRRGMGRYSIFGLADSEGRGLDQAALMDFTSGNIGSGDLARRAHRNVNTMGRAQAINREGLLRGALMEQGGLAGQIGMMRMMVGDRAMDGGDDLMSQVMQRRLHMSRPQAEIMTSLMRNQSSIAAREAADTASSSREAGLRSDIRENRSLDAFTRHLEHGIQDATGMLAARDLGRTFVTRVSASAEKLMNDLLGISSDQMSTTGQAAMNRMRQGRASRGDLASLGMTAGGFAGGDEAFNIDSQGLLETGPSVGARLRARGMDTSGIRTYGDAMSALGVAQSADMGIVRGRDASLLASMNRDVAGSSRRVLEARLASGGSDDFYRFAGGGNATAAFMAQHGIANPARADATSRLYGRGGGEVSAGMIGRDILRGVASVATLGLMPLMASASSHAAGMGGESFMSSEVMAAMRNPMDDTDDFLASGGHLARRLEQQGQQGRRGELQRRYARGEIDARQVRAGMTALDRDAGMLENMRGVSREDMQSVRGNEQFMERMRGVIGASGDGRTAAMERLTEYVGSQESGRGTTAMESVVAQMHESMRANNGELGSEFARFSSDSPGLREARRRVQEHGIGLQQMATQMGNVGLGGVFGAMGEAARSGNSDQYYRAQEMTGVMAERMTDEQWRDAVESGMAMTGVAEGDRDRVAAERRSIFMALGQRRTEHENLQGRGRRGRRGAAETAIGMATGYGTGDMELNVGGRRVRGQAAQTMLQRALSGDVRGQAGTDILESFQAHARDINGMGLTETQAGEMQRILQQGFSRRGRDGSFRPEDERALREFTGREDIQQAQSQANERRAAQALSSAEARDPVGRRTNELLTTISTTLTNRLVDPSGTGGNGPNMSLPGGGTATSP